MNLDGVKNMLNDYFSVSLPDDYLIDIINSDEYLLEDVIDGAHTDTMFRDSLINTISKSIGVSVGVADMLGQIGSHSWPCYGVSEEYNKEYFSQFREKIINIGGIFE